MGSMRTISTVVVAVAVAMLATACRFTDPSDNTTVDFTGTLLPGGGNVHQFTARNSGEYSVKLTAFAPNGNLGASIYLGQTVDGLCVRILGEEGQANLTQAFAIDGPIQKGTYCIQFFDILPLPQPQTYTLRVSHP